MRFSDISPILGSYVPTMLRYKIIQSFSTRTCLIRVTFLSYLHFASLLGDGYLIKLREKVILHLGNFITIFDFSFLIIADISLTTGMLFAVE